jgi:hypothetical protein
MSSILSIRVGFEPVWLPEWIGEEPRPVSDRDHVTRLPVPADACAGNARTELATVAP